MSTVQPQGEQLRNAVRWVSEQRAHSPEINLTKLVDEACLRFDLSPKDSEFLTRFVKNDSSSHPA